MYHFPHIQHPAALHYIYYRSRYRCNIIYHRCAQPWMYRYITEVITATFADINMLYLDSQTLGIWIVSISPRMLMLLSWVLRHINIIHVSWPNKTKHFGFTQIQKCRHSSLLESLADPGRGDTPDMCPHLISATHKFNTPRYSLIEYSKNVNLSFTSFTATSYKLRHGLNLSK